MEIEETCSSTSIQGIGYEEDNCLKIDNNLKQYGNGAPQSRVRNRALLKKANSEAMLQSNIAELNQQEQLVEILVKYSNNPHGWTPLAYAIYLQDISAVQILLKNGSDPNQFNPGFHYPNIPSNTWFIMFLEFGNRDGVRFRSAKIKDPYSTTYSEKERQLFKLLIDAGIQPNFHAKDSTIKIATSIIKMEWNECLWPFIKNLPEVELSHVFSIAASLKKYKACEQLLSYGLNPNKIDPGHPSHLPLYWAIVEGQLDIIQLLLNNGADPNHEMINRYGGSIALAVRSIHSKEIQKQIIELLLKHGAKP